VFRCITVINRTAAVALDEIYKPKKVFLRTTVPKNFLLASLADYLYLQFNLNLFRRPCLPLLFKLHACTTFGQLIPREIISKFLPPDAIF